MYGLSKRIAVLESKIENFHKSSEQSILPTYEELKDFIKFQKYFFKLRTNHDFVISQPSSRQSHHLALAQVVPRIINHEMEGLVIRMPPRYGKTEWAINFIAYCLAYYPDSQFIYVVYAKKIATMQSAEVKRIIQLPEFERIYGVKLSGDTKAKDHFMTNRGGQVYATGAEGPITGFGAGIANQTCFGGCIFIDDVHKADEVHSDTMRGSVHRWYRQTLSTRFNNPKAPCVAIGQGLHEDDLLERFIHDPDFDTRKWQVLLLEALDASGNALDPSKHTVEQLKDMQEKNRYVFWSQYQQKPQPAGGGIFREEEFVLLENNPHILTTFITVDTAETDKTWNDRTVFSFWGLYKIKQNGIQTDIFGLHWLNCWELSIEPKDLNESFMQFYFECCQFSVKPLVIGIEKASTGVTLLSTLKELQGVKVVDTRDFHVDPFTGNTMRNQNKIKGFLDCQPYVSSKQISFTEGIKHAKLCIEHMGKITANGTHMRDDIADTCKDAIFMALITDFIPSYRGIIRAHSRPELTIKPRPRFKW